MLRDVTTCSVRSTAFAVYNKVALAEQGGSFLQQHRTGLGADTAGHSARSQAAPLHADSDVGSEGHGAAWGSSRHRRCWVECCAAFPPFKLAQVSLGPAIQPPVIEEGQQPQGWLEEFCKGHEPRAELAAAAGATGTSPSATKGCERHARAVHIRSSVLL